MLSTDSVRARQHLKNQARYNITLKLLPAGTQLGTNVVTIPQKVVIHQTVPPIIVLVVENPSIVQLHRELFEIAWRS